MVIGLQIGLLAQEVVEDHLGGVPNGQGKGTVGDEGNGGH